jgi:hypothetical protein
LIEFGDDHGPVLPSARHTRCFQNDAPAEQVAAFMETGFCQIFRLCIDVQFASGVNACGESRLPAALADARALTAALPTRH